MIQRKKRIHTGAEQFDIGIHGAKLPEFYVSDIGLMGDTDVDIEDDTGLFDVLGTDDNSNNRYMRPRICHMPSECVRYENAEQLARDLKITTGIRIDTFVSGSFVFGDFIEAFLRINNCKAVNMTICTLSLNQENVDSLYLLMTKGFIDNLKLLISGYFYTHERRALIPYL